MDVTIRCYLLGQCIESTIDLLEESDELETPWTEEA